MFEPPCNASPDPARPRGVGEHQRRLALRLPASSRPPNTGQMRVLNQVNWRISGELSIQIFGNSGQGHPALRHCMTPRTWWRSFQSASAFGIQQARWCRPSTRCSCLLRTGGYTSVTTGKRIIPSTLEPGLYVYWGGCYKVTLVLGHGIGAAIVGAVAFFRPWTHLTPYSVHYVPRLPMRSLYSRA